MNLEDDTILTETLRLGYLEEAKNNSFILCFKCFSHRSSLERSMGEKKTQDYITLMPSPQKKTSDGTFTN